MEVFGNSLRRMDILKRIGDCSQFGKAKFYKFVDGVSKDLRAIDINTISGMNLTVLADRGLDISHLSYKGIPISYKSKIGETSPLYFESKNDEWLRTYYGGLFITCGLTYFGEPCIDENEELGLHGRISNISAENVCIDENWQDDNYFFKIKGRIRETKFYGDYLELNRKIIVPMDNPRIIMEDQIENIGFKISPFMILYHINVGYPLLDKSTKIIGAKSNVKPLDKNNTESFNEFFEPIENYKYKVYVHDITPDNEGNSNIAIVNPAFNNNHGIGLAIKYNKENLPYLIQWKQLGYSEYACGLEPANSLVRGRAKEKEENNIRFLKPGEKVTNKLEFTILTSNEDIEKFKKITN